MCVCRKRRVVTRCARLRLLPPPFSIADRDSATWWSFAVESFDVCSSSTILPQYTDRIDIHALAEGFVSTAAAA